MSLKTHTEPSSTTANQLRITELDLVRGFALCGIFFLNIISMGYLVEAYINPYAFTVSDVTSPEEITWFDGEVLNNFFFISTHLFIDQKMMGLFSLLFGASSMLFLSGLKAKNQSGFYYYKRNLWLLLIGLLHATFLYSGDILFIYSICALFLFPFSRLRPTLQLIIGLIIYCLPIYLQFKLQMSVAGLSMEQYQELTELWQPSIESVLSSIEFERNANYMDWVFTPFLWDTNGDIYSMYLNSYIIEGFARSFGLMLIGMAFFTIGILPNYENRKSITFYKKLLNFGFSIGFTTIILGLCLNYYHEWDVSYSVFGGRLLNHIGTPFVSCAYLAMLVLVSNTSNLSSHVKKLILGLQAMGRMALTNYIMQSTFGLLLFTNVGLSLFGKLNRLELAIIAIAICLFQFYFSAFWLKRFKYGPLEWLWRRLTYIKLIGRTSQS